MRVRKWSLGLFRIVAYGLHIAPVDPPSEKPRGYLYSKSSLAISIAGNTSPGTHYRFQDRAPVPALYYEEGGAGRFSLPRSAHLGVMASAGGNVLRELKDLGGWKSRVMVDRHAKFATEHLTAAASRIEADGCGENVVQ